MGSYQKQFAKSQKKGDSHYLHAVKARAGRAFVSNAAGIWAATGKKGGEGGGGDDTGGVLVDRTAGTRPCSVWQGVVKFPSTQITTSSFSSTSSSFPAILSFFLLLILFLPAGYSCAGEALMGRADSTDKWVNWLVGCTKRTHRSTQRNILSDWLSATHYMAKLHSPAHRGDTKWALSHEAKQRRFSMHIHTYRHTSADVQPVTRGLPTGFPYTPFSLCLY